MVSVRELAKFMRNPAWVYQQGGNHFCGKKKRGQEPFFDEKKGGKHFFLKIIERGDTYFHDKMGGHEMFSISIVQILLSKITL